MIGLLLAAAAALQPVAGVPPRRAPAPAAKAAEVELWVLDQISFPMPQDEKFTATLKAIEPDHTMEAVATRLALLGVKFERTIITIDTSKMPPALLSQVKTLPAGEPFAIPDRQRMTINAILSRRMQAVGPGERASPPPLSAAAAAGIDRLLDVMNVESQFDAQVTRLVDAMVPGISAGNTGRTDEVRKIVGEEMRTSFQKSRALMMAKARELYLVRFSVAELNQLVAFYETPLGRKVTSMAPGISAEMSVFGQQLGRAASLDARPRILERLRAANLQTPQGV